MTRSAVFLVATLTLAVAWQARGDVAPSAPEPNMVHKEMHLLEVAMKDSVAAIAAGDVRGLPKKLHAVHIASGDTTKALKSGAYKTPRNSDKVDAFIALDAAFHKEMIAMVKAAKKNNVDETAKYFGKLMVRCNGCHSTYR